jgi:DNA replication and repair protein RecF
MHLETLHLLNFKNYLEANLHFSPRINVLVGKNGSGKTSLLDAIFYLGFTKSAFSSSDQQCITQGQPFFFIKGEFKTGSGFREIATSVQLGTKKIFKEDSIEYSKLSEHIGKYPIVLIAPDDVDLIKEGSEGRRKFFDGLISQLDKLYLDSLIQYNQALKLRNSLLRMYAERGGAVDWVVMESYERIMSQTGEIIFQWRSNFNKEFLPVFQKYYQYLVENAEWAEIRYSTELNDIGFLKGLLDSRQKDVALQRTNFGIHRDDYEFILANEALKKFGSQGQQKSFVIAMKLAQFEILENHKGFKPILLLDDIFDKLDDFRIARLLELIKSGFGQLFITDARPERTKGLLDQIKVQSTIFTIDQGKVNLYEQQEK